LESSGLHFCLFVNPRSVPSGTADLLGRSLSFVSLRRSLRPQL
jgi:hypothetical protein